MRAITMIAVLLTALPSAAVQAKSDKPKEARQCRQSPAISSRLPGRMVCKTAKQWEHEDFYLQRGAAWLQGSSINHPDVNAAPRLGGR